MTDKLSHSFNIANMRIDLTGEKDKAKGVLRVSIITPLPYLNRKIDLKLDDCIKETEKALNWLKA